MAFDFKSIKPSVSGQPSAQPKVEVDFKTIKPVRDEAKETFLDSMASLEGTERHVDAVGIDTHGYGLTEANRKSMKIPQGDARGMAGQAYQHFYDKVKKKIPDIDSRDTASKVFATSAAWNTGKVWGSVKGLVESQDFDTKVVSSWLENTKAGGKNIPGIGNRRAKDYNVLAKDRGWPVVTHTEYDNEVAIFSLDNGKEIRIKRSGMPDRDKTSL